MNIIDEARTWVGTAYHHQARVKGAGVDCANLIAGVLENCGWPKFHLDTYSTQWHLHNTEEKLLNILESYGCKRLQDAAVGSIITFKFGKVSSHIGIITSPTTFIHADVRVGKVTEVSLNGQWAQLVSGYWSLPEKIDDNKNSTL